MTLVNDRPLDKPQSLMARLPKLNGQQVWAMLIVVCLYLYFTEPNFGTTFNIANVLLDCSFVALLSVGLTPLIITRNIDLSVGSTLGLSACLVAILSPFLGGLAAAVVTLVAGTLISLANGILVRLFRLDSFIVTLAAMIGLRGVSFAVAGQGSVSLADPALVWLAGLSVGPFSCIAIAALGLALVTQFVLSRTVHGRNAHAIGGSEAAAVNAGIGVSFNVLVNFAFAGFMAALAGIAMATSLGAANANFGRGYELWAIAAVVLGGTRLTGGTGNAINSFAAALLLSVLRNGMNIKQVQSFYVLVVMGAALILALLVDRYLTNRSAKRSKANARA